MLTASPNKCSVLSNRNINPHNNAITEGSDGLFQLGFELVDNLGFTPKAYLIGWFTLPWAVVILVSMFAMSSR